MDFSLGIEQEFQLIDVSTGQLAPGINAILRRGQPLLGEHIKPESKQACVELISSVCSSMADARAELTRLVRVLWHVAEQEGLALLSAGTHPTAAWQDQAVTNEAHYLRLEEEFQDLERELLIYGLHIHVAIEDPDLRIHLFNQVRTWLPHLLALSTNSPFRAGRATGLKSMRAATWKSLPRTGIPDTFASWQAYQRLVKKLTQAGCIESGKDLCWDLRPHPVYPTLEFRIADMPATLDDTLALAALCQAIVVKCAWLYQHHQRLPLASRIYLEENKWRAMRYGLDAQLVDFGRARCLPARDALHQLLDFVDEVVDDLGSQAEMLTLRRLLESPQGTGADQQLTVFARTGDPHQVVWSLYEKARSFCVPEETIKAARPEIRV